jgi:hypothetical protein
MRHLRIASWPGNNSNGKGINTEDTEEHGGLRSERLSSVFLRVLCGPMQFGSRPAVGFLLF